MVRRTEYSSLREGLVGAWCPSLGATGNTLLDRSGRNNHGTLTNMGGQDNWRAAGSGTALTLDGTDDYVSTSLLGPTGNRSVSLWFSTTKSLSTGQLQLLIGWGPASTGQQFSVLVGTVAGLGTNGFGVTQYGDSIGFGNNADGKIRHGAVVNNGSVYTVYLDGVERGQKTMTTNATSGSVVIGKNPNSAADYFLGSIEDIRIYNRALTPSEILLLASRRGIGLAPLPDRAAAMPRKLSVNVAGTWRPADAYLNVGGAWKLSEAKTNVGGVWR
jgi:hypothetical protein